MVKYQYRSIKRFQHEPQRSSNWVTTNSQSCSWSHLVLWEELSSTAFKTVAGLRVKITKVVLIVPTADLAHLGEEDRFSEHVDMKEDCFAAKHSNNEDHLVDVVLPCKHLK